MPTKDAVIQQLRSINPQASDEDLQTQFSSIVNGADPVLRNQVASNLFSDVRRQELLDKGASDQDSWRAVADDVLTAIGAWGSRSNPVQAVQASQDRRRAQGKDTISEFDRAQERFANEGKAQTEALGAKRRMTAEDVTANTAATKYTQDQKQYREENDPNSDTANALRQAAYTTLPHVTPGSLDGASAKSLREQITILSGAQQQAIMNEANRIAADRVDTIDTRTQNEKATALKLEASRYAETQKDKQEAAKAAVEAKAIIEPQDKQMINAVDNEIDRLESLKKAGQHTNIGWGSAFQHSVREKFGVENDAFKQLKAQAEAVPESNRDIKGYKPIEIPLNNGLEAFNKTIDGQIALLKSRQGTVLQSAKHRGKDISEFSPQIQAPGATNKPAWAK